MTERKINFSISEGEASFAHETSINFGPTQFILDFKTVTPRMDVRAQQGQVLAVKHNVVMMEPYGTKEFARMLSDMVKKYEKEFGGIVKPAAVAKFEKKAKNRKERKDDAPLAYLG